MPKSNLASMSVDALLRLRDDVEKVLSRKADELKYQLSRLDEEIGPRKQGRRRLLKSRKLPVKYRDKSGNVWAGRGAMPIWLREKLKAGAKLETFAVHKLRPRRKKKGRKTKR
jgi:DNA-binding protein H-NS